MVLTIDPTLHESGVLVLLGVDDAHAAQHFAVQQPGHHLLRCHRARRQAPDVLGAHFVGLLGQREVHLVTQVQVVRVTLKVAAHNTETFDYCGLHQNSRKRLISNFKAFGSSTCTFHFFFTFN